MRPTQQIRNLIDAIRSADNLQDVREMVDEISILMDLVKDDFGVRQRSFFDAEVNADDAIKRGNKQ